MPYSFETNHKKIPEQYDRRRKLTEVQKMEIVNRYQAGGCSLNSLAKEFGVSKKLILITVNPISKEKNSRRIKEHWRDYQVFGEEYNRIITEHRHYKHNLDLDNKLEQ